MVATAETAPIERASSQPGDLSYAIPVDSLAEPRTIRHLLRFGQPRPLRSSAMRFYRMYQPDDMAFENVAERRDGKVVDACNEALVMRRTGIGVALLALSCLVGCLPTSVLAAAEASSGPQGDPRIELVFGTPDAPRAFRLGADGTEGEEIPASRAHAAGQSLETVRLRVSDRQHATAADYQCTGKNRSEESYCCRPGERIGRDAARWHSLADCIFCHNVSASMKPNGAITGISAQSRCRTGYCVSMPCNPRPKSVPIRC